jgi:hypothetical protein
MYRSALEILGLLIAVSMACDCVSVDVKLTAHGSSPRSYLRENGATVE